MEVFPCDSAQRECRIQIIYSLQINETITGKQNDCRLTSTKTVTIPLTQRQIALFRHSTIRGAVKGRKLRLFIFLKSLLLNSLVWTFLNWISSNSFKLIEIGLVFFNLWFLVFFLLVEHFWQMLGGPFFLWYCKQLKKTEVLTRLTTIIHHNEEN